MSVGRTDGGVTDGVNAPDDAQDTSNAQAPADDGGSSTAVADRAYQPASTGSPDAARVQDQMANASAPDATGGAGGGEDDGSLATLTDGGDGTNAPDGSGGTSAPDAGGGTAPTEGPSGPDFRKAPPGLSDKVADKLGISKDVVDNVFEAFGADKLVHAADAADIAVKLVQDIKSGNKTNILKDIHDLGKSEAAADLVGKLVEAATESPEAGELATLAVTVVQEGLDNLTGELDDNAIALRDKLGQDTFNAALAAAGVKGRANKLGVDGDRLSQLSTQVFGLGSQAGQALNNIVDKGDAAGAKDALATCTKLQNKYLEPGRFTSNPDTGGYNEIENASDDELKAFAKQAADGINYCKIEKRAGHTEGTNAFLDGLIQDQQQILEVDARPIGERARELREQGREAAGDRRRPEERPDALRARAGRSEGLRRDFQDLGRPPRAWLGRDRGDPDQEGDRRLLEEDARRAARRSHREHRRHREVDPDGDQVRRGLQGRQEHGHGGGPPADGPRFRAGRDRDPRPGRDRLLDGGELREERHGGRGLGRGQPLQVDRPAADRQGQPDRPGRAHRRAHADDPVPIAKKAGCDNDTALMVAEMQTKVFPTGTTGVGAVIQQMLLKGDGPGLKKVVDAWKQLGPKCLLPGECRGDDGNIVDASADQRRTWFNQAQSGSSAVQSSVWAKKDPAAFYQALLADQQKMMQQLTDQ